MLACMGASAGIIVASNGQTISSWKIEPAVLLAVLSSIWNYSLGAVFGISVSITWWRTASRGTTLESLHYIWNQGAVLNPISALRSSAAARKVVLLAWLVVSVQIANNPLWQRSTHIGTENVVVQDSMTLDMTPRLPDGWLGSIQNASEASIIGSRDGLSTVQDWWKNATIDISNGNRTGTQCDGTCEGKVQGTGMAYTCTSSTIGLDFSAEQNVGAVIFAINTTMSTNSTGAPILVLETVFASAIDDSCIATLNISTCTIEAAIVEYPIVMQNNTVTLDITTSQPPPIVSKYTSAGDLPTAGTGQGAGPLEGLNDFFGAYLFANVTLLIDPSRNISLYSGGGDLIPDLFFLPSAADYDESILHKCGLKWADPTPYVIGSMQNFLFRASIGASTDADAQTFAVQRSNLQLIFESNYSYLAAALVVMLVALLAVLWQLWGWWELGRQVSLSPLEVVGAFRALATQREDYKVVAVGRILELVGKTSVKYDGQRFSGSAVAEQGMELGRDEGGSEG
jgi:hypothetical protein